MEALRIPVSGLAWVFFILSFMVVDCLVIESDTLLFHSFHMLSYLFSTYFTYTCTIRELDCKPFFCVWVKTGLIFSFSSSKIKPYKTYANSCHLIARYNI